MEQDENIDFNQLIEMSRKGDIVSQKILYEYCVNVVRPIEYHYRGLAKKIGFNDYDMHNLVTEAFFQILVDEEVEYTNFEAYFKKRYEYVLLGKFRELRAMKHRVLINSLNELVSYDSCGKAISNDLDKIGIDDVKETINGQELLEHLMKKTPVLNEIEKKILLMYLEGQNLYQIASELNRSYYEVRKKFLVIKSKIKEEFKELDVM